MSAPTSRELAMTTQSTQIRAYYGLCVYALVTTLMALVAIAGSVRASSDRDDITDITMDVSAIMASIDTTTLPVYEVKDAV